MAQLIYTSNVQNKGILKIQKKGFTENDHCRAKLTTRRICLRSADRKLREKNPLKSDYRSFFLNLLYAKVQLDMTYNQTLSDD